jgi:asparagine synthase (glutamine-hydrolysing)
VTYARLDHVPSWFVVLPDCRAAEPVDAALRSQATCVMRHPSGRAWLVGRWAQEEITVAQSRGTAIAVIGEHLLSAAFLTRVASRVGTLADLDEPSSSWAGNFHLIASVAGDVRVQSPISGFRRVLHASVDGVTVAANRADVLAGLTGAALDEARLTVALLEPCAPHRRTADVAWPGGRARRVLPDDRLCWTAPVCAVVDRAGAGRTDGRGCDRAACGVVVRRRGTNPGP